MYGLIKKGSSHRSKVLYTFILSQPQSKQGRSFAFQSFHQPYISHNELLVFLFTVIVKTNLDQSAVPTCQQTPNDRLSITFQHEFRSEIAPSIL